ncbi:PREDICTED: tumor necrosis factor receptor superfamily member 4-like [Ceratosolen solmsi marchali]|uniref:Tumor necrosis factor receptor superfamily member 4-like n=1 Tax=Ceratosolen solmsi marchali TaxID=326594 RepID=A0AAJ6YHY3_9HYME|nr:PREDICTED: tumor necrosis factor receptor superfamily member 4-like [Ceratosolen solmsi marchali]
MTLDRMSAMCIVLLFAISSLIEVGEGRAHLRHHRGDSHCSRCAPGWGVLEPCGRGRDTVCAECQPGTYSPHHGSQPCWICSRCGPGLYEARHCNPSADTLCDSCHRRAPNNADYRRKCAGSPGVFLAPEDARDTGEQSELVNEDSVDGDEEGVDEEKDREGRERLLWEDAQAQMREDEGKSNALRPE